MSKTAARKPKPAALQTKKHRDLQRFLSYKPPVDSVRIYDMREALESGRDLTPAIRLEITLALSVLHNFILLQDLARARAHPNSDFVTRWASQVVAALVTKYGVLVKTAVRATLPNGDKKALARVVRAYSKLKKTMVFAHNEKQIEEAAARLTPSQKEKGAARLQGQRRKKGKQ